MFFDAGLTRECLTREYLTRDCLTGPVDPRRSDSI